MRALLANQITMIYKTCIRVFNLYLPPIVQNFYLDELKEVQKMKELMMSSLRKLVDDVLRHIVLEDDVLKEKTGHTLMLNGRII